MTGRPIGELFDAIERDTPYRIFAPAGTELDSLRVSVGPGSRPVADIIREALAGSPYQVTALENTIFILKGRNLVTTLPEWFYSEIAAATPDSLSSSFVLFSE